MEKLPPDIVRVLLTLLQYDALALGLTCKWIYSIYTVKRDKNYLIARRFERVSRKYMKCLREQSCGVVFDRMKKSRFGDGMLVKWVAKCFSPKDIPVDNLVVWIDGSYAAIRKMTMIHVIDRGSIVESIWTYDDRYYIGRYRLYFSVASFTVKMQYPKPKNQWTHCDAQAAMKGVLPLAKYIEDSNGGLKYDMEGANHWVPGVSDTIENGIIDMQFDTEWGDWNWYLRGKY